MIRSARSIGPCVGTPRRPGPVPPGPAVRRAAGASDAVASSRSSPSSAQLPGEDAVSCPSDDREGFAGRWRFAKVRSAIEDSSVHWHGFAGKHADPVPGSTAATGVNTVVPSAARRRQVSKVSAAGGFQQRPAHGARGQRPAHRVHHEQDRHDLVVYRARQSMCSMRMPQTPRTMPARNSISR